MLFYVPLESLKERYTLQWSAPKTGWLERNWIKAGIEYTRIDGEVDEKPKDIKVGVVLDAVGRSTFCFSQIKKLLAMLAEGQISNSDVIYFDDFWTPGIEALPYAFAMYGVPDSRRGSRLTSRRAHPKMYAFCHAQSVDEFDFTYPMRDWMRSFEKGIASVLSGIFVSSPVLRDLLAEGGVADRSKVHVTGLVFSSEEVRQRMPVYGGPREDKVVFSSRWDSEKNPKFFLQVAERVLLSRPNTKFVICSGSSRMRSNDPSNLEALMASSAKFPDNIIAKPGLTKEEYYKELATAKIQMSTADQDWVSITLLEASVAGAFPIYPYFRSFPDALRRQPEFFYERLDVEHASKKVIDVLDRNDLWTWASMEERRWIHERFDSTWQRQLGVMGLAQ